MSAADALVTIGFEAGGNYITATAAGRVLIRCNAAATDIRDDEPLPDFVARHGGAFKTAEYLKQAYSNY